MKYLKSLLLSCLVSTSVFATSGFNLSLTPDFAIHQRTETIHGFSLGIWSENPQHAFALGVVNGSTKDSAGFSLGIVNYSQNYEGFMWSVVNYTRGNFVGLQLGTVNYAGKLTGLQFGLVNIANRAEKGLQLGLVNIISENKAWFSHFPSQLAPAMILANWRF
jgi:hypothetical protein